MADFTLDAWVAIEYGTDFTLDALVKATVADSFTLDAYVSNPTVTTVTEFFRLDAYVRNDNWDAAQDFVSPHDRNRHDRGDDMHFGTTPANLVNATSIGSYATVEDVIRDLWTRFHDAESFWGSRFTLDAYVDENVFWRDTFERTVVQDLGDSTSRSTFGIFSWQREDPGSLVVSVNGHEAQYSNVASFIGHPTITEGELYAEVFFPNATNEDWAFKFQPWRDDVTDVVCVVRERYIGFQAVVPSYETADGTPIVEGSGSSIAPTSAGDWFAVKWKLPVAGDPLMTKIWHRDTETEPDWDDTGSTMPDPNVGHRFVTVGINAAIAHSDDGTTWTENDEPPGRNYQDICVGDAYGITTWMTVGSSGGVGISRDAETWTYMDDYHSTTFPYPIIGSLPTFWSCATDGAGTWIAVNLGFSGGDLRPWRAIGDPETSFWVPQTAFSSAFRWLRWGNGLFLSIGVSDAKLDSSPDGGTWTSRSSGLVEGTDWLQDGAYGSGAGWVLIGGDGSDGLGVKTAVSADGLTWTAYTIAALYNNGLLAIATDGIYYVAVGYNYDTNDGVIAYSTDGVNWTINTNQTISGNELRAVAYANGQWVAVGDNGIVYETSDPTGTWTLVHTASNWLFAIASHPQVNSRPTPLFTMDANTALRTAFVDNVKVFKTDSDAARLYHTFSLDAQVAPPTFGSFTLDAMVAMRLTSTFTLDAWVLAAFRLDAIVKATVYHDDPHDATMLGDFTLGSMDDLFAYNRNQPFRLDAWVLHTFSSSFTLNAIAKATVSGSFSLNAYVNLYGSYTLDGWVKSTRSGSFTLNAYVQTSEMGLLGDHKLGNHELGGE